MRTRSPKQSNTPSHQSQHVEIPLLICRTRLTIRARDRGDNYFDPATEVLLYEPLDRESVERYGL